MRNTITLNRAMDIIYKTGGKVFGATFTKRTTGEIRHMSCRLGVTKGVTGKGMNYDPADKALLTVYDFHKKGFRMIALDALHSIRVEHKTYRIK